MSGTRIAPAAQPVARPYEPSGAEAWNAFVDRSKNGTFLLRRDYLDYHADRFTDASLTVSAGGELLALFPANRAGDEVVSHGGLTYGGLVLDERATVESVVAIWAAVAERLRADGARGVVYKTIPAMYHRVPAEEDRYALFRCGARLVRRDVLAVIAPPGDAPLHASTRRATDRARRAPGIATGASQDWPGFWDVLERRLHERHGVGPVHSLAEMTLLAGRFPASIRLVTATVDGAIAAGAVLYESARVVHAQYLATSELARKLSLLDLVLRDAIEDARAKGKWFDLGASMERDGSLNAGLAQYKAKFGAGTAVHDVYAVDLAR